MFDANLVIGALIVIASTLEIPQVYLGFVETARLKESAAKLSHAAFKLSFLKQGIFAVNSTLLIVFKEGSPLLLFPSFYWTVYVSLRYIMYRQACKGKSTLADKVVIVDDVLKEMMSWKW